MRISSSISSIVGHCKWLRPVSGSRIEYLEKLVAILIYSLFKRGDEGEALHRLREAQRRGVVIGTLFKENEDSWRKAGPPLRRAIEGLIGETDNLASP